MWGNPFLEGSTIGGGLTKVRDSWVFPQATLLIQRRELLCYYLCCNIIYSQKGRIPKCNIPGTTDDFTSGCVPLNATRSSVSFEQVLEWPASCSPALGRIRDSLTEDCRRESRFCMPSTKKGKQISKVRAVLAKALHWGRVCFRSVVCSVTQVCLSLIACCSVF